MKKLQLLTFCIFSLSILFQTNFLLAQSPQVEIHGKVTHKVTNEPLIGATILITGTEVGTITDWDGTYKLLWNPEEKINLECQYTGYSTQKKTIDALYKRKIEVNFEMEVQEAHLEEVEVSAMRLSGKTTTSSDIVVAGYGSVEKASKKSARKAKKKRAFADVSAAYDRVVPTESMMMSTAPMAEASRKPAPETNSNIAAGTLTAGEIHDFSKWDLWQDIATEDLNQWENHWNFHLTERYTVQVRTNDGFPIVGAVVHLKEGNESIWTAQTDNTGKAELWNGVFDAQKAAGKNLRAVVEYKDKKYKIDELTVFQKGVNFLKIEEACQTVPVLDIAFVVDATGSMGDEIAYLQAELKDVIERVQAKSEDLTINLGSVFYKDETDDYVTRKFDFTEDISATISFIQEQAAGGGGDYPEAVDSALDIALNELKWSEKAVAKLLFLVLDAPPHYTPEILKKLEELTHLATEKGVRIIPIAGSGIDKSTEYLMRSFALTTNGTYVFLTDHSGVGNAHIEPTTDEYEVEKFNDLLIRVIGQFAKIRDCNEPVALNEDPTKTGTNGHNTNENNSNQVNCYPNPTTGIFRVKLEKPVKELFITDIAGKILLRFDDLKEGETEINLSNFPSGIYFVRFMENEKLKTSKIVLAY